MRLIPKFQEGGFSSLFTQYTPVLSALGSGAPARTLSSGASSEASSSSSKESTSGKLTEKDLFDLISKIDGLPNDTKAIVSNLSHLFSAASYSGGSSIANLASAYLANLYAIKSADFNKKEYDRAYELVTQKGGLNEYAITSSGAVIVTDNEDNIKQVTALELLQNPEKYQPLTNSNLLYLRAYKPEYSNNNSILSVVANGIGIDLVDKMIREKLSNLGTNETSRSGYSVKKDSYIILGLSVLSEIDSKLIAGEAGMTLDGLYKNKIISKDLKQLAAAALEYIYNTLPTNAKTLLAIKSGNSSDVKKGAQQVILLLISSRMSQSSTSDTDYEGTLDQVLKKGTNSSKKSSSSDSSNSGDAEYSDDIKSSPYLSMARMQGGSPTTLTVNRGTNYSMSTDGVNYASIPDIHDEPVEATSLENLLNKGLKGAITDSRDITFGDVLLDDEDLSNILYNGRGGTMAILPAKESPTGGKMINMDVLKNYETAMNDLKKKGITSIYDENHLEEIVKAFYDNKLTDYINLNNGSIDYTKFALFLVIDGYAVADSDKNKFKNNNSIKWMPDDDKLIKYIEKGLSTNSDKNNFKYDKDEFWDLNGYNLIYRGSIYIPFSNNQGQLINASGQHVKEGAMTLKEEDYQMWQKLMSATASKSSMLLNGLVKI